MPRRIDDNKTWEEVSHIVLKRLVKAKKLKTEKEVKKFKKWFMDREEVGLRFDWRLVYRCWKIWNWLRDDKDHFITICGEEGAGKSTIAAQIASWIQGKSFDIKQICLLSTDYFDSLQGDKYRALILDELILQMFSRDAMSGESKNISKLFFIMRALNLATVCCIPNLKYADSILREHRTKTLIIIKKRGSYKCVTSEGIAIVAKSIRKKQQKINHIQIPYDYFFEGHFRKDYPLNISQEEYTKKKLAAVDKFINDTKRGLVQQKMVSLAKASKVCGLDSQTILKLIHKKELKAKKIGYKWMISKDSLDNLIKT